MEDRAAGWGNGAAPIAWARGIRYGRYGAHLGRSEVPTSYLIEALYVKRIVNAQIPSQARGKTPPSTYVCR